MDERTLLYEERLPMLAVLVTKFYILLGILFLWAFLVNLLSTQGVPPSISLGLGLAFLLAFAFGIWLRTKRPNQIWMDNKHVILKNGKKEYAIPFVDIVGISPAVLSLRYPRGSQWLHRGIGLPMQARRIGANGEAQGEPLRINVVSFELSGWSGHWDGIIIDAQTTRPYFFHCTDPRGISEQIRKHLH